MKNEWIHYVLWTLDGFLSDDLEEEYCQRHPSGLVVAIPDQREAAAHPPPMFVDDDGESTTASSSETAPAPSAASSVPPPPPSTPPPPLPLVILPPPPAAKRMRVADDDEEGEDNGPANAVVRVSRRRRAVLGHGSDKFARSANTAFHPPRSAGN
jgi:hypothetical protein